MATGGVTFCARAKIRTAKNAGHPYLFLGDMRDWNYCKRGAGHLLAWLHEVSAIEWDSPSPHQSARPFRSGRLWPGELPLRGFSRRRWAAHLASAAARAHRIRRISLPELVVVRGESAADQFGKARRTRLPIARRSRPAARFSGRPGGLRERDSVQVQIAAQGFP